MFGVALILLFVNAGDDSQPPDEVSDLAASHHGKEALVDVLVVLETLQSHLIFNIIWGFGFLL